MKFFSKKVLKITAVFFILFWVGVFSLSALYTYLEEKKQQDLIDELQKPYLEDTYGGATPEETFELFLDALKDGDMELASKYFIIERQGEWGNYFKAVVKESRMEEMINDLTVGKLTYIRSLYKGDKQFEIKNENGKVIFDSIHFGKYPTGIWKITDL